MEGTVDVDVSGSKLDSLLSLNQALYFHLDADEFLEPRVVTLNTMYQTKL